MIDAQEHNTILALHEKGYSLRKIARLLSLNRRTVTRVVNEEKEDPSIRTDHIDLNEELLRTLYQECDGWAQRVYEKLTEEHNISIAYSTLTQKLRELGLSNRVKKKNKRFHHVETEPGEEMQHDTSPYTVSLGGVPTRVTASIIYLRYSKMIYLRFYLQFRRYEMKCFLHEALQFFGYSAKKCIIDNTNLARLSGIGYNAVIQKEMESFALRYGFEFICHERGHSNRKAGNERAFWTTETNFLPGRAFDSLSDMNKQAFEWATDRRARKAHSKTKLIPIETFEQEKPHLTQVPSHIQGPTQTHGRTIDPYGYVELYTNFFWVPGKDRKPVLVIEHPELIDITHNRKTLVRYEKPAQDIRKQIFAPDGVDVRPVHLRRERTTQTEEKALRTMPYPIPEYLEFLQTEVKGKRKAHLIRAIYEMSKTVTVDLFIKTIERALRYRICDVGVIENIADMILNTRGLTLPRCNIDPELMKRKEYQEGCLIEAPDLSEYDKRYSEEK